MELLRYGDGHAETVLGQALKAVEKDYPRSSYYIATKICESYLHPGVIEERLDASLARLQTEYIDLYQIHWHSRAAVKTGRYPERPLPAEVEVLILLSAPCPQLRL